METRKSEGVSTRRIVVIAGPTASGKSRLALAIAEALAADGVGAVLINADSMQVYRQLRVLTARPSEADEQRVAHRLYGVLSVACPCSAGRWRDMALAAIDEALAAARLPIVVGGSGLYLRALLDGLSPIPEIPPDVRAAAGARFAALGEAGFRRALAACDAAAEARIAPGDRQRLVRAWEVVEASGRPLSDWQAEARDPLPLPALKLLLAPARAALAAACDARLEAMIAGGGLDEVAALLAAGTDPRLPAMKALGVPALVAHLAGELTLEEAMALAKRATRRYAKRQQTWFRHQYSPDMVIAPGADATAPALAAVKSFLLTGGGAETSVRAL